LSGADLQAQAGEARRWLFDDAFPLWSTAGFDARSGQFVEQLTAAGAPVIDAPRRTLVQARQLYVFAVAARMGWDGPWRPIMTAAADTLMSRGRTETGDWIFSFDADARPLDPRPDLYTQAFAIFGLAHAAVALDRADLLAAARDTRRRLELGWRAPGGGFVEGEVHPGLRRQNPHMHLLEAVMALREAGGDPAGDPLADELVALFKHRFAAPCGLLEYFDDQLVPVTDDRGRINEPGHVFEWAWLIGRWAATSGADETELIDRLLASGRRGVSDDGWVRDELWADGRMKSATARLWPQAERVKAALARLERTGAPADAADVRSALSALDGYLDGVPSGSWRDRREPDGRWRAGPAPASSGYHVVGALDELIKFAAARA
jgi:mannose/cellobiose epimerase-like protein (N-acyl-D-glucosamine 2-epimerase family)